MSHKSYLELKDVPSDGLKSLPSMLASIKYGELSDPQKREVIVLKETFLLRNPNGTKVGVFTRSSRDHRATVGDCSVLLHGDFLREECRIDNGGKLIYDVNDRLHEHLGPYSSLFRPVKAQESPLIHYHNKRTQRRYVFVVFEMICTEPPAPMFLKLKTRIEDAFVGFHDVKDVAAGLKKYNKTPIEVDENVCKRIKRRTMFQKREASILNIDAKIALAAPEITMFKVNVIGL